MEFITNFVQSHALAISSTILIVAYIFIAWEKISKVTIAMLGSPTTLSQDEKNSDVTSGTQN